MVGACVERGFDTKVIVPFDGPLVPLLEKAGAKVHILDSLVLRRADIRRLGLVRLFMKWAIATFKLGQFAHRNKFSLVHSNCMPTLGGILLAKIAGVPHVWHIHEIFDDNWLARQVFERLLARSDAIIAASQSVSDQLRSSTLKRRVRIAYTGAEVPSDLSSVVPLRRRVPEVICVGRLNQWKGQDCLLRAVYLLREESVECRLVFVGGVFAQEMHFQSRLERLVTELDMQSRVALLGERTDALQLMANADIVVVPSTKPEPFGMVVIEAMKLGRPVVASDAGGPSEIIKPWEDGLLFACGDVDELAARIRWLIENPETAKQLGDEARRTAQRFSPAAMTEQILDVYGNLLAAV